MNQKYALQDKVIKYYPEEITRLNNKNATNENKTILKKVGAKTSTFFICYK